MIELFNAIREGSGSQIWSKGVAISRANAVLSENLSNDELVLRVKVAGKSISPKVTLWPEEEDWNCDCGSEEDPCEHVAAAVIALRQAKEKGIALPALEVAAGKLVYSLTEETDGLHFARAIVVDGQPHPLKTSLSALVNGRVAGPQVTASKEDMKVDLVLDRFKHGLIPKNLCVRLLTALSEVESQVQLNGKDISIGSDSVGIIARVEDRGGGFYLHGLQDPNIEKVYANGIARCKGNILHAVGDGGLLPNQIKLLKDGQQYGERETSTLVSEILPKLREKIKVEVLTKKLPQGRRLLPRLMLETKGKGLYLEVMPCIVYGDPIIAKVEGDYLKVMGDGPVPERNRSQETKLIDDWQKAYHLPVGKASFFEGEEAVGFTDKLQSFRGDISGEGLQAFSRQEPLVVELDFQSDDIKVSFSSGGKGSADPKAVLEAWQNGDQMVPLINGGWAEIPAGWLHKHGQKLLSLLAAKQDQEKLPKAGLFLLAELAEEIDEDIPADVAKMKEAISSFDRVKEYNLPRDLRAELRHYQKDGVNWLGFLKELQMGAVLADDMGLGKTLQTICVLSGKSLVIVPTSVLHNWQREIEAFRPSLKVQLFYGPNRELDLDQNDIVITSYGVLRMDQDRLSQIEWDVIVLDESQTIKNSSSQVARAAFSLKADFRVCLSGTPVENRLEEFWSQMHFANPGLLSGRKDFAERFVKPITAGDETAVVSLQKRVKPFILRRLKKEVATELPNKTEVVLEVELSNEERTIYQSILAATKKQVIEKLQSGGGVMEALEALLRLRQASCHGRLVPGQVIERSSKIDLLMEQLEKSLANEHKALVFSQWTSLLDIIEGEFFEKKLPYYRIDGQTKNRQDIVDKFQTDGQPNVLLMSLKAGGVGLNLTAADHIFIVDPWWNPAAEDQAADRAYRIGQKNKVLVHRLVSVGTVEEKILALQSKKRQLSHAALGEARAGASITRDDLLALLV